MDGAKLDVGLPMRTKAACLVRWLLFAGLPFAGLSVATLAGCGAPDEDALVGTYDASREWGTSTLVLHADHTYVQTHTTLGRATISNRGRWDYAPDKLANEVRLHECVVPYNASGNLRAHARAGVCIYPVVHRYPGFGPLQLGTEGEPYMKRSR